MRKAYLLSVDFESPRTIFSKNLLEKIGFNVILFQAIKNTDKVISNKLSLLAIYKIISDDNEDWSYIFEDDINILSPICISDIIEYENISESFFYLGCCVYNYYKILKTEQIINNYNVYKTSFGIRGHHAIGVSKKGALEIINFSQKFDTQKYMDVILENFARFHPANILRFDLDNGIGHRGLFFQDRKQFPSLIF